MDQGIELGALGVEIEPLMVWGAGALLVAFVIFIWGVSKVLCICRPNEILVISGRKQAAADGGAASGYKLLRGGRGIRIPLIEEIHRMDMRLIPVMVEVQNAFSKGGIPLTVHAIANVKVTGHRGHIGNAVERLLGMSNRQIGAIAQQTLEGVLREVVAELTPEEVNEDRLKFADTLVKHAKDDLDKIGLDLDVLKIQTVTDEQDYLNNLGRAQIARMLRDAQNAENEANQIIAEAQAAARQRAESAQKQAEAQVLTKRNELRAELARLEAEAKAVENEAQIASETARAEAEQELQQLRSEVERLRLEVEVYLPAEAQRLASEAEARANAAPVVESGKATAEALKLVAQQWQTAGRDGRDLYVLQHIKEFVEAAVHRVTRVRPEAFTVVDGGDGKSFTNAVASFPAAVREVMNETGKAVGVDMNALLDTGRNREVAR